jgi:hypothetical protein
VVRIAEDRSVRKGVRNLVWVDPRDVGDDEIRQVGAVGGHEVVSRHCCLELAAEEELDAGQQDSRHGPSRVTLPPVEEELRRGLEQMRSGLYFEAHESFEDAWRAADPAEKDFFQGLVHVTVAWYQARRGNRTGCERQLAKAKRRLAAFVPAHRGVDVATVLRCVGEAADTVAAGSLDLPPPEGLERP